MTSVHRRNSLSTEKSEEAVADLEPVQPSGALLSNGWWRIPIRRLSYVIALAFLLTGPSLAGSTDRDMPGVGTFTYCGSPRQR